MSDTCVHDTADAVGTAPPPPPPPLGNVPQLLRKEHLLGAHPFDESLRNTKPPKKSAEVPSGADPVGGGN